MAPHTEVGTFKREMDRLFYRLWEVGFAPLTRDEYLLTFDGESVEAGRLHAVPHSQGLRASSRVGSERP